MIEFSFGLQNIFHYKFWQRATGVSSYTNRDLVAHLAASEEESSGYRFQMLGDPQSDQLVLLGKLIEKMRRLLGFVHIRSSDTGCRSSTRLSAAE